MWEGSVGYLTKIGSYYVKDSVVVVETESCFAFRVDVVDGFRSEVMDVKMGVEGSGKSSSSAGDTALDIGKARRVHGYERLCVDGVGWCWRRGE